MTVRAVFMGSPAWAVPCLKALAGAQAQGIAVTGVLTQPDRPAGRGRRLQPCPVKIAAQQLGFRVHSPPSLRADAGFAELAGLEPDVVVVCAYGQILSRRALDLPRLGCWNLHFSLLPRWRGASPVQAAILAGDPATGVSLQRMVEQLDAGPLVSNSAPLPIGPHETADALGHRLAEAAGTLLTGTLPAILSGMPTLTSQDEAKATVCRKLDKHAGLIDWAAEPAQDIDRKVRAFTPWPGCASYLGRTRLGLIRVEPVFSRGHAQAPGELAADGIVPAAAGWVRLLEVKPEGRGAMRFADFINGHPEALGARLEATPHPQTAH